MTFESHFSENVIIKNWFMSVGIWLAVFEIATSPRSDIRSIRSKFLVRDLDEYYHLKASMISFSEKWLSKILLNEIFFPHKNFWKKFSKIFSKKRFFLNFFFEIFSSFFSIFWKNYFWKPFFRKFNHQKLIHVSWDMIDSFMQLRYLQSLTSDFIALNF